MAAWTEGSRTRRFYDAIAPRYDEIYADWRQSVGRQGRVLDRLLTDLGLDATELVLDCACGIGTQLIGLALEGRNVTGTDLSPAAVARAAAEAAGRGFQPGLAAADMRALPFRAGQFAAVLCADNSLPHLTTPQDLAAGLAEIARVLRPGGRLLVSTRDYDRARQIQPTTTAPSVRVTAGGRSISFQVWHWHTDGERYDIEQFFLTEQTGSSDWTVDRHTATYWALTRDQIRQALTEAGFVSIVWHDPDELGFFQPLAVAAKP